MNFLYFIRSPSFLANGTNTRYLSVLVAFMLFLLSLILIGVLHLERSIQHWHGTIETTFSIQITPTSGTDTQDLLDNALTILRNIPEVQTATPISRAEMEQYLTPWLGQFAQSADLPLPLFIDVTTKPGSDVSATTLNLHFATIASSVVIDDHRVWLNTLIRLLRSIILVALVMTAIIIALCVFSIVFITRSDLTIHADTIEVLSLIGAEDTFIARCFAARSAGMALKGACVGVGLAFISAFAMTWGLRAFHINFFQHITRNFYDDWLILTVLALLPVFSAYVAHRTARKTALRALQIPSGTI